MSLLVMEYILTLVQMDFCCIRSILLILISFYAYTCFSTTEAPGPIDNSDIMPCNKSLYSYRNSGSFNYPTLSSIPLGNYECVSAEVWSLLFNIYGGGPTISVCQPTYSSSINNSIDENQMDDLSDHSSSDQFSQKCSSNSTPNEQSPLNSDRIDEQVCSCFNGIFVLRN